MRVNIYDVAYRAGVSVVTVSRVINNVPTVRERNKQKVLKAMKELNYEPNAAARALAGQVRGYRPFNPKPRGRLFWQGY